MSILRSLSKHKAICFFLPFAGTFAAAIYYVGRWWADGHEWTAGAKTVAFRVAASITFYLMVRLSLWWWARVENRYWDELR